jgi:SpoVK/Ycf46/Vps4 family AAA+-type ATPase
MSPILPVPEAGYAWPELVPMLHATMAERISALILGPPGVGKSALAARLADDLGLPIIDVRLAQQEPADLAGVYFPDGDQLRLLAPQWVRTACETPSFVFLDEVNAAVSRLHQAVAYQMVLEHRLGPFVFHPDTVVLAAGNREEDRALASSLSSALSNRFAHFELRVDAPTWVAWARSEGLDPRVIAFVERGREDVLYDQPEGAQAFASPRTWALASRLLTRLPPDHARRAVAACVGAPMAQRFVSFLGLYQRVNPERMMRTGRLPDFTRGRAAEPSRLHATVSAVADWLRVDGHELPDDALEHVVAFLTAPGLDPEHAIVALRRFWSNAVLAARLRTTRSFREAASDLVGIHPAVRA